MMTEKNPNQNPKRGELKMLMVICHHGLLFAAASQDKIRAGILKGIAFQLQ